MISPQPGSLNSGIGTPKAKANTSQQKKHRKRREQQRFPGMPGALGQRGKPDCRAQCRSKAEILNQGSKDQRRTDDDQQGTPRNTRQTTRLILERIHDGNHAKNGQQRNNDQREKARPHLGGRTDLQIPPENQINQRNADEKQACCTVLVTNTYRFCHDPHP